jgi:hypothetical protein
VIRSVSPNYVRTFRVSPTNYVRTFRVSVMHEMLYLTIAGGDFLTFCRCIFELDSANEGRKTSMPAGGRLCAFPPYGIRLLSWGFPFELCLLDFRVR